MRMDPEPVLSHTYSGTLFIWNCFNVILSSTHNYRKWLISLRFSLLKFCVQFSFLAWFNVFFGGGVQITKFLILIFCSIMLTPFSNVQIFSSAFCFQRAAVLILPPVQGTNIYTPSLAQCLKLIFSIFQSLNFCFVFGAIAPQ
jgi:hypothetical protein